MGEIGTQELLLLMVILGVPASILAGAVVYVVRLARRGTAPTLRQASRRRDLG
ncbi:hypothetical protein RIF23_20235 [Lipingzhangella sp. LS1_29]|uniref:Uncharacterized protein n=1 Tax=Lipingzhangella rawalii TaxID=2055835 RepID=A0ABU2HBA6_9ACTN|nr:hypothetical protein [Lipingzhangella rawalii]MDS1272620.1 hypothetical protein [Lipingzhangella rawalii]